MASKFFKKGSLLGSASQAKEKGDAVQAPENANTFAASAARKTLIQTLARQRDAHVLVLLDNHGHSAPGLMRHLFEHLRTTHGRSHERISLVLFECRSRALDLAQAQQSMERAQRIQALLREYGREIEVLVPQVAFGMATLMAMGADRVLMHPMASLGNVHGATAMIHAQHFVSLATSSTFVASELAETPDAIKPQTVLMAQRQASMIKLAEEMGAENLGQRAYTQTRLREGLARLITSRVHPRHETSVEAVQKALDSLECPLGQTLDRRSARELLKLPMETLEPEQETTLWELFCAYEHPLGLGAATQSAPNSRDLKSKLGASHARAPRVVLESASTCHAWYTARGKQAPGWRALHESSLH